MLDLPVTRAIIELLGEVALLLWGVHMVQQRRPACVSAATSAACSAGPCATASRRLLAGLGVTLALQSSTATALMATSFLAAGVIGPVPASGDRCWAPTSARHWSPGRCAFDVTLVFPLLILPA